MSLGRATLPNFNLIATANNNNNSIRLDWTLPDATNKTFKVFQKREGSSTFQSISSTNFDNGKQIKVLNVYPNYGIKVNYTTWDGEKMSLPKGASLKEWMEKPNSESAKGYGKGIIEVTAVDIALFNSNPKMYLYDDKGNYKYDVIMFGSADANDYKDLSQASASETKKFIETGRGALFGHDTLRTNEFPYFRQLSSFANIAPYEKVYNGVALTDGYGVKSSIFKSDVTIAKTGLLTNYPWEVGIIGTNLKVPSAHNNQRANGDIWVRFKHSSYDEYSSTKDPDNFYLSTWNNTATIQTGHSNGAATSDEQKLLANTLFYLNQLNSETFLNDKSGQDIKAPNLPGIETLPSKPDELKFNFDKTTDNGSLYEYYVIAEDKQNNKIQSNTASATITTGISGFSYIFDTKPNTEPDNSIDHSSGVLSMSDIQNEKTYYLHIKAMDKVGNIGPTRHYRVDTKKPLEPILNISRTGWGKTNVDFNISQPHNKNLKILSLITVADSTFANRLKALGYNVTEDANLTNLNEISKYDVVIVDAYVWTITNGKFINQLYNLGTKIITVGNDSGSEILHIESSEPEGSNVDLSMNRVLENEATYMLKNYDSGRDSQSYTITSVNKDASIWYRQNRNNNPYVMYLDNGLGGEWIHSQSPLGRTNSYESDEFIMGLLDYITDHISPFHIRNVQYKINNGSWISYDGGSVKITEEGEYTVSVRNIDNRGVSSDISSKLVGIDRTSPVLSIETPSKTTSRTISVTLSNIYDTLSGANKVRLSNYKDFRDNNNYTSVADKTSATLSITIPFFSDLKENYSNRTIYAELLDKAGNSKIVSSTTMYEPKAPEVPIIITPKNDELFTTKGTIILSWIYDDVNNDGVKLPQDKFIINIQDTSTKETSRHDYIGGSTSEILPGFQKLYISAQN